MITVIEKGKPEGQDLSHASGKGEAARDSQLIVKKVKVRFCPSEVGVVGEENSRMTPYLASVRCCVMKELLS